MPTGPTHAGPDARVLLLLLSVHPLGLAVLAALRLLGAVLGAVELQLAIAIVRVARAKRGRGAHGLLRREGLGEPVRPLPGVQGLGLGLGLGFGCGCGVGLP